MGNYVRLKNGSVYYEHLNPQYSDPELPVLVFLHEGLGCVELWREFPKTVSDRAKLPALVYDRFGSGKSERLTGQRSPEFLHEEALKVLPEILDKLNISGKVLLIGHSDGGSISLIYGAELKERVSGMIIIAAHTFIEEITLNGIEDAVNEYNKGEFKSRLGKYHGEKTDTLFYGWSDVWLSEEFRSFDIRGNLNNIDCPVLIIQGEDDQFGSVDQVDSIADVITQSETFIVPSCGHVPHLQKEDVVLKRVLEFIDKVCN